MTDRTYPPLPQSLGMQLEAIRMQMEFDAGYLLAPECPYPEQVRVFLRKLVQPTRAGRDDLIEVFRPGQTNDEEADSLIAEIQSAINSMKTLQQDMAKDTVDVGDRLNFLKNYGSLIDRFLSLKEKSQGMKQIYEFQRVVMGVMDEMLDKDSRLEFKNRLKKIGLEGTNAEGAG